MSEFTYFDDGQVDRVVGLVWQVAQEVHVVRQRLLALESLLASKGVMDEGELSGFIPNEAAAQGLEEDGVALMERLIRTISESDDHRAPMRVQFTEKLVESAS